MYEQYCQTNWGGGIIEARRNSLHLSRSLSSTLGKSINKNKRMWQSVDDR